MRHSPALWLSFLPRFQRDERGVQLVEVALVIPILLILLAATAEFGRYFYYYSTLSGATRAAVRYLAAKPFEDGAAPNDFKTQARRLAVCGSRDTCAANTELLPGLTLSNFEITSAGGTAANFPDTITVQVVNYTYQPIFDLGNLVGGAAWTNVPIKASTTMRYMLTN